jgi:ankyrin repeat protein
MNSIDQELIVAARENNLPEVCRLLSAGAGMNAHGTFDWTPLHWAYYYGNVQVLKELLKHGVGVNANPNDD